MSGPILPIFSRIWHTDPSVRITSSTQLVAHLEVAQSGYSAEKAAEEAKETGVHDDGLASDVSYSLKRLIRGLASPRESARLGFAVALTELLHRLSDITARSVLSILLASSEIGASVKGAEERDLLFARLFGIHAIISSGLLFRPSGSLHDWRVAIEEVLVLGDRKTWLRESVGWVVQCATKELINRKDVEWRNEGLQAVLDAYFPKERHLNVEWTPERLALVILLQDANFDASWTDLTKPAFANPILLSSNDNLVAIARILRGLSAAPQSKKANNQASAVFLGSGQLHYVWREIVQIYFPASKQEGESPKKKAKSSLPESAKKLSVLDFYRIVVDESLFNSTSTTAAKYVGLTAFSTFFQNASSQAAPHFITPSLIRTLINHSVKGERSLHTLATQTIRVISSTVAAKPDMAYEILMRLFAKPYGNTRFDAVTRTKTVEEIVSSLPDADCQKYIDWLFAYILDAGVESSSEDEQDEMEVDAPQIDDPNHDKSIESQRSWAVDQLLLLIRKQAKPSTDVDAQPQWIVRILEFTALHGFFVLQRETKKSNLVSLRVKPANAFSSNTQAVLRTRFFSALAHLITINQRCRGQNWSSKAVDIVRALQQDEKHITALIPLESTEEIQTQVKLHQRLSKVEDETQKQAILLLSEVLILQGYDPTSDARQLYEELSDAAEAMFFTVSKSKAAKKAQTDEEGEAAEPVSVLIDLLVNLLQKPSALLRVTAERVFGAVSKGLTEQAIQLLLDQISPESEELVDDESSDIDEEDKDGGELSKADGEAEESDDEDSDDEDSDDDLDDLDLDADPELKDKIAAALASMGMGDEDEELKNGANDIEEEEEEELLDDEQMMQLDEKLAEIFRSRKASNNEERAEQENALNARLKIIDILEIYAKQQASNPLILLLISPLYEIACKTTGPKDEVANKASKVLRGIVHKPKEIPSVEDATTVLPVLSSIHAMTRRYANPDASSLGGIVSAYLVRITQPHKSKELKDQVAEIYSTSLTDYLLKKHSRVLPSLFTTLAQRTPQAAWPLRERLLEACSEESSTKDKFKRLQAYHILGETLTAYAAQKTDTSRTQILAFLPDVSRTLASTLFACAKGEGMQLPVARVKELLKFCTLLVRIAKAASGANSAQSLADSLQSEALGESLKAVSESQQLKNASSLSAPIRQILQSIDTAATAKSNLKVKPSQVTANGQGAAAVQNAGRKTAGKKRKAAN